MMGQEVRNDLKKSEFVKSTLDKVKSSTAVRKNYTKKYLEKFDRHQGKFLKKLCKVNSKKADALYLDWSNSKIQLKHSQNSTGNGRFSRGHGEVYNSYNDSLLSILKFEGNDSSLQVIEEYKQQLNDEALVHNYMIRQKDLMKKVSSDIPSLQKYYTPLSKDSYYLNQQLGEVQKIFQNSDKLEKEFFGRISSDPAFSKYFQSNSTLSSIKIPENWGKTIEGLQTNNFVKGIQSADINQLSEAGKEKIINLISEGAKSIESMKNDFPKLTNASDVPDFKPNALKTKSFTKRIKYGIDFQLDPSKEFYPSGILGGLNLGYQLDLNSMIGIGFAIHSLFNSKEEVKGIPDNNLSLRSFFDKRIKGVVFFTTGYERNYSNTDFKFIKPNEEHLLSGLKFKYGFGSKLGFQISLLYDFLYDQHIPISKQLVYRIGYNF